MLRVIIGVLVFALWGESGFAALRFSGAIAGCEALLADESVDQLPSERKIEVIQRYLGKPALFEAAYSGLRFSAAEETLLLQELIQKMEAETSYGSSVYNSIISIAPLLKGQDTLEWLTFLKGTLPSFEETLMELYVPEFWERAIGVLRPEYQDQLLEWMDSLEYFDCTTAKFSFEGSEVLLSDLSFLSRKQKLRFLAQSLLRKVENDRTWPDPLNETQREVLFGKRFSYRDFHELFSRFAQAKFRGAEVGLNSLSKLIDQVIKWAGGHRKEKKWQKSRLLFPFTVWGAIKQEYYDRFKVDLDQFGEFDLIQKSFSLFAKQHPDLMDIEFGDRVFFSATKDPNDLRALIEIYDFHRAEIGHEVSDSAELLAEISGASVEFWHRRNPEKNYESVVHLVLRLAELKPQFLKEVQVEPSALVQPQRLASFLEAVASLAGLAEVNRDIDLWGSLLGPDKVLSLESLNGGLKRWKYIKFREELKMGLQQDGEPRLEDPGISLETYQDLQRRWGDLRPLTTLVERMRGEANRGSLETLMGVLNAGIEGRFAELKYGKKYSDPQIAFLTPARRKVWVKDAARVALAGFQAEEVPLETILHNRMDVLLEHGAIVSLVRQLQRGRGMPRGLNQLLERIERGSPKRLVGQWLDERGMEGVEKRIQTLKRLFRWAIADYDAWMRNLEESIEESDLIRLKRASRVALGAIELLRQVGVDDFYRGDFNELKRSLRSIETAATLDWGQVSNDGLVLSVISGDPMFSLTVGNLVPSCGSCLSYESGGMIRALPGYTVDANTKIGASFHLGSRDFGDRSLYQKLYRELIEGEKPEVSWDGNLRRVRFVLQSGETVRSKPLEQAYLRRVIRVGKVRKGKLGRTGKYRKPGVFAEQRYRSDHRYDEQMDLQLKEMIDDLRKKLGAETTNAIYFGATKNPGGTYSDGLNGIQRGAFVLKPRDEEK